MMTQKPECRAVRRRNLAGQSVVEVSGKKQESQPLAVEASVECQAEERSAVEQAHVANTSAAPPPPGLCQATVRHFRDVVGRNRGTTFEDVVSTPVEDAPGVVLQTPRTTHAVTPRCCLP
ncbi:unnamed protein product [Ixodes pacificus]